MISWLGWRGFRRQLVESESPALRSLIVFHLCSRWETSKLRVTSVGAVTCQPISELAEREGFYYHSF